jgi:hypothetical protein
MFRKHSLILVAVVVVCFPKTRDMMLPRRRDARDAREIRRLAERT